MLHREPPPREARNAILEGLRILAMLDPDRADHRNDIGFSAADSRRGHQLAMPLLLEAEATEGLALVLRYHRQLPADVVAAARRQPPRAVFSLSDALDELASLRSARAA